MKPQLLTLECPLVARGISRNSHKSILFKYLLLGIALGVISNFIMFRSNPCILILALINVSNKMLFLTWGPRGSKVRDTEVGDPAMEVMLGVQR